MNLTSHGHVSVWAQGSYELAEGARWVDGRMVFTDILAGELLELTATAPRSARSLARLPTALGAVAPVHGKPGPPQPTSVCLPPSGGQLLVTTARYGLTNPPAPSGAILSVQVPGSAPPARAYRPG